MVKCGHFTRWMTPATLFFSSSKTCHAASKPTKPWTAWKQVHTSSAILSILALHLWSISLDSLRGIVVLRPRLLSLKPLSEASFGGFGQLLGGLSCSWTYRALIKHLAPGSLFPDPRSPGPPPMALGAARGIDYIIQGSCASCQSFAPMLTSSINHLRMNPV